MKNETFKYILGGILFGGIAVWLIAISVINSSNTGMMQMMGIRTTTGLGITQNSDIMDAHFIEQMIPHHEDAITMSRLALTKAKTTEVKQLAESIIDSQSREITQMKDWYRQWFGKDVPLDSEVMGGHGMTGKSTMHMGMMGNETDIKSLETSDDFDRKFVEGMIPHHQMAVMMAQMLKNGTKKPEMKKLSEDIITAQTKEIELMRDWLKEWNN